MSDPLEQEIRSALARRAAVLPPDAAHWLTEIDYAAPDVRRSRRPRPRWRSRQRRLWRRPALGAAAAALTAGIAVAVVLLTSTTPVAYAGWTPVPTTPTPASVKLARAACDAMHPGPLAAKAIGGRPVLIDARGRYTALVSVAGDVLSICISAGSHATGVGGSNLSFDAKPGPDQLGLFSGGGGSAPGFAGASGEEHLVGMAGSDVTGVKFVFANGVTVVATVQNGWYFAWWPYQRNPRRGILPPASDPTSVEATTNSGKTLTSSLLAKRCHPGQPGCLFAGFNPARHR
jgi:hypothetical protein